MPKQKRINLSELTEHQFPLIKKLDQGQEDMVIKLYKHGRVIVDAVAGSGKTTVLTQAMKVLLDKGEIDQIVYVVFPVQEGALGFLPGDLSDKIKEYAVPFVEALIDAGVNPHDPDLDIRNMCNVHIHGKYKVVPHTFLRGRTMRKKGVFGDEVQNGVMKELKKFFTRVGDDCYVAIAGHNEQSDIKNSGFPAYIHHFKQGIQSGEFTDIDFAHLEINYRGKFSAFADKAGQYVKEEKKT
jgi:phosphate starvation-inducible protein PhoH